jgi:hypothetical protein
MFMGERKGKGRTGVETAIRAGVSGNGNKFREHRDFGSEEYEKIVGTVVPCDLFLS